jgi:hypothetical protein
LAGAIHGVYQRQVFVLEVFIIVKTLHMLDETLHTLDFDLLPDILNITVFTMFLEVMVAFSQNWENSTMTSRDIVNTVMSSACKIGDNMI